MQLNRGFGEREPQPRSLRWPRELAKRVEKIAEELDQDFPMAVFELMRWACDEWDREKMKAEQKKAG